MTSAEWESHKAARRKHMDANGNVPASVVFGPGTSGVTHLPSWEVCERLWAESVKNILTHPERRM